MEIKQNFRDGFKIFLSHINYVAKFEFDENKIALTADTNKGSFEITGIGM